MDPVSIEKFNEMFEHLFTAHDKNGNGYLEKDEAIEMVKVINSKRPDGKEFDQEKFDELWAAKAEGDRISKEHAHAMCLKRGQTLGFIAHE